MSDQPSYPKDAAVGAAATAGGEKAGNGAPRAAVTGRVEPKRTKHLVAGAAIGIGSAALVAALLYARSSGKKS